MTARILVEHTVELPAIHTMSSLDEPEATADARVEFAYGDHHRALAALTAAYQKVRDELEAMDRPVKR